MFRRTALAAGLALGVLAAACASTGEPRSGVSATVITHDEIAASTTNNAYDLIRSLRPRWLHDRGQQTLGTTTRQTATGPVTEMTTTGIIVYVDGTRMGSAGTLREISTRDLRSAERLSAGEATRRFGGGHTHGAILLTTR
jgi:hypothetical protein